VNELQRKQFGEYLRGLRAETQLTQKSASEQAGISAPYLSQLERGERNPPSQKVLTKLAAVYQSPPEELWHKADRVDSAENPPSYALIRGLLHQLPQSGQWTQQRRDQWLGAVTANIDFLIDVLDEQQKAIK